MMPPQRPWAQPLLRALLPPRDRDSISGDLWEEYLDMMASRSRARAELWYLRQTLSFLNYSWVWRMVRHLPPALVWASAAAACQYAILFALPQWKSFRPETAAFRFSSTLLVASAAARIRGGVEARTVLQAACFWFICFAAAAAVAITRQPFNPVPAVAAFLAIAPGAGFHATARGGSIRAGIAAATAAGIFSIAFAAVVIDGLALPHPPLASIAMLPWVAALLGAVGAAFGARFGPARFTQGRCRPMPDTSLRLS